MMTSNTAPDTTMVRAMATPEGVTFGLSFGGAVVVVDPQMHSYTMQDGQYVYPVTLQSLLQGLQLP